MMIIRCSAGRMEWNGFILVLIAAIIDMFCSCGFIILMIAGALAIIGMEWTCNHGDNDRNSHYRHDNLFADVQWLSIV